MPKQTAYCHIHGAMPVSDCPECIERFGLKEEEKKNADGGASDDRPKRRSNARKGARKR